MNSDEHLQSQGRVLFFEHNNQVINVSLFPRVNDTKELSSFVDQKPVIVNYPLHVAASNVQWKSKDSMNILIAHGYTKEGNHLLLQPNIPLSTFVLQTNDRLFRMNLRPIDFVISCQETENVQELLPHSPILSVAAASVGWNLADGIVYLDINTMRKGNRRIISPFEDTNHPKYSLVRDRFYQFL